jgi:hypothetical protein
MFGLQLGVRWRRQWLPCITAARSKVLKGSWHSVNPEKHKISSCGGSPVTHDIDAILRWHFSQKGRPPSARPTQGASVRDVLRADRRSRGAVFAARVNWKAARCRSAACRGRMRRSQQFLAVGMSGGCCMTSAPQHDGPLHWMPPAECLQTPQPLPHNASAGAMECARLRVQNLKHALPHAARADEKGLQQADRGPRCFSLLQLHSQASPARRPRSFPVSLP